MKLIRNAFACIVLSIACLSIGHAEQAPGEGAGYYGSAEYSNGGSSLVGPFATWIECSSALEAAVENAANNNADNGSWSVISVSGCGFYHHYFANVAEAAPHLIELDIVANSPWDSVRKVRDLLRRVRETRARHAADEYEAALIAISRSSAYE
jgi:hypothetical protein